MSRAPGCSPAWNSSPKDGASSSLTDEQREIVREVVLGGRSVFFTGGAGVGKSHLLKNIVSRLDPRTTYVTATTGLAACAIGGVTVHHWAGIGAGDRPISDLVSMALRKRGQQWRSATALVIDEISMLDGDIFDALDQVLVPIHVHMREHVHVRVCVRVRVRVTTNSYVRYYHPLIVCTVILSTCRPLP